MVNHQGNNVQTDEVEIRYKLRVYVHYHELATSTTYV